MPTASDTTVNTEAARAAARSFVYRYLAEAFAYPEAEGWTWAATAQSAATLRTAVAEGWPDARGLPALATVTASALRATPLEEARRDHLRAFGYTIRGACPPHEIEYGDHKADALFRPHRLADISALYRAFGTGVDPSVKERQDHLAIECEFASILAARSAHAIQSSQVDAMDVCAEALKLFLREHLGRWTPAFSSRLDTMAPSPWLRQAATFLLAVVHADCALHGIKPGAADIQLVSYDESDESFCTNTCGVNTPVPAA